MTSRTLNGALALFLALFMPPLATANAGAGAWETVAGARVRLIVAGAPEQGAGDAVSPPPDAALEFEMEPGWHIYWRFPGETGIPTEADFSASRGLEAATLRYPAPERHDDGYSTSIVYKDHVVLPIDLVTDGSADPAVLRATVRFGICSDICVPGEAHLELPLAGERDLTQQMKIASARLKLPLPQDDTAPRIVSVTIEDSGGSDASTILVEADLSGSGTSIDLFAEGAPGSYNAVPRLLERKGKSARFTLPVTGLKSADDGSRPLELTLVEGARAVTFQTDIPGDASPSR
ncbi:MAG: hypothetical protein CMN86_01185 [Stappia sp.]|nr:hypothetical protein [Stappia sp.]